LPSAVASWSLAIIGLTNIFGSLYAGACVGRYRSKYVLFWMYASRAALIAVYLAAPKTDLTFYLFAAGLGFPGWRRCHRRRRSPASCLACAISGCCSA
jgi:predicted MFS family arabinose efflux permease